MSEGKKILIIEDDVDMVEAMKVILAPTDHKVIAAYTPEEGLQMAKKEKPDVIILDVMFGSSGKTQGFDCAVKLKQDKELAPIPILMVTAVNVANKDYKFSPDTDGEYLPVDCFIDKPAQPDILIKKIHSLIAKKTSDWVNWPHKKED